jgi:probable F420-dependent oxidoreductase
MTQTLRFGLHGINQRLATDPAVAMRVAQLAEEVGFDSLWAGEHVVLPDPRTPDSGMDPDDPILDPIVALTFVAANTKQILLGTGVIVLPQRQPLVLAKEAASLDVLSGGRLLLGIGAGYFAPEFAAIGVPLADRGTRTDDYLAAMQAIWSGRGVSHQGLYSSFSGMTAFPLPVQRPGPRIIVGGHSPAAYRRAVEQGHGWYGWGQDPDRAMAAVAALRHAEQEYERPAALGPLEISITPPGWPAWVDRATAERYAAAGVDRLILQIGPLSEADIAERLRKAADEMVGQIPVLTAP